jgi:hypothetical protein
LAGAAGGTLGAAATGGNLGSGAVGGGISGGISAALAPGPASGAAPQGGAASSAGAAAAPASVAAPGADATVGVGAGNIGTAADYNAGFQAGLSGSQLGGNVSLNQTTGADLSSTGGQTNLGGGTGGGTAGGASTGSLSSANTPGSVGTGAASGVSSNTTGFVSPSSIPGGANAPAGTVQAPNISTNLGTLNAQAPSLAGQPTTSVGQFLQDPSLSSALNVVEQNPLQTLAGGALAYDVIAGNQQTSQQKALNAQAGSDIAQGNQLQSYLSSGQLPPGMQAQINSATQAAQASVRQQYANRGMSGSSAEAQDLQNVQEQASANAGNMAIQLFQQGMNESQLGSEIYNNLMQVTLQQDQQLSSGITNFVSALAGISRPIVLTNAGVLS